MMKSLFKKSALIVLVSLILIGQYACQHEDQDHYTIAVAPAAPFVMYDGGNFSGVEIDIIATIAEDQGFTYSMSQMPFEEMLSTIDSGKVDIAISNIYITPERRLKYALTDAYYQAGYVLLISSTNTDIEGFDDLAGKRVAAESGSSSLSFLTDNKDKYGYEIILLETPVEAFCAVANGYIDATFIDTPFAEYAIACGMNLQIVSEEYELSEVAMIARNGDKKLLNTLNQGLENLRANGKLQGILNRYFKQ